MNPKAEKALLGALIQRPEYLHVAEKYIVSPDVFSMPHTQLIWLALQSLAEKNTKIDPVTVFTECERQEPGGIAVEYIEQAATASTENLEEYARIVLEDHIRTKAALDGSRLREWILKLPPHEFVEKISRYRDDLDSLVKLQVTKERELSKIVTNYMGDIKAGANIIRTGLPWLDNIQGGFSRGELTAIAGRPGQNKTTFKLFLIRSLVMGGLKVGTFEREMTTIEVIKKLMAMESDTLKLSDMRKLEISDETKREIDRLEQKIADIYSKKLYIYDDVYTQSQTIAEIERERFDVYADDYIQLTEPVDPSMDRRFQIEDIVRRYKRVSKKINSHGILISQMSRDIDKRISQVPVLADFAEGAAIEHNIESAIFLVYKHSYDHNEPANKVDLYCRKARYGTPGHYEMGYNGEHATFYKAS